MNFRPPTLNTIERWYTDCEFLLTVIAPENDPYGPIEVCSTLLGGEWVPIIGLRIGGLPVEYTTTDTLSAINRALLEYGNLRMCRIYARRIDDGPFMTPIWVGSKGAMPRKYSLKSDTSGDIHGETTT